MAVVPNENSAVYEPIAVSLSEATGDTLIAAQTDLAEIRAHMELDPVACLFNGENVMICDYGTQAAGDFDVTATLYTFNESVSRTSGQAEGISTHTYTQNGYVRFKLYFYMIFSYDGTSVVPVVNEELAWASTDEATLNVTNEGYTTGSTSTYTWIYSVTYGNTTLTNKHATITCTNQGVVTRYDESMVFPAS